MVNMLLTLCKYFVHVLTQYSHSQIGAIESECSSTSGDRRYNQDFVAFLEGVLVIAEEANVFFVHVKVDEATYLAIFATQVLAKRRKEALNLDDELRKVCSSALNLANVTGVALECVGQ
jgi:hypothetical protein